MIYIFEIFTMDKKMSEVNSRHEEEGEDNIEEIREDNIEAAKKQQQQKPKSKEDVIESTNSSDQKWPTT
jgi:hypothetical protein